MQQLNLIKEMFSYFPIRYIAKMFLVVVYYSVYNKKT